MKKIQNCVNTHAKMVNVLLAILAVIAINQFAVLPTKIFQDVTKDLKKMYTMMKKLAVNLKYAYQMMATVLIRHLQNVILVVI